MVTWSMVADCVITMAAQINNFVWRLSWAFVFLNRVSCGARGVGRLAELRRHQAPSHHRCWRKITKPRPKAKSECSRTSNAATT